MDAFGRPVQRPEPPQPPKALQIARWLWVGAVLVGVVQAFMHHPELLMLDETDFWPGPAGAAGGAAPGH